MPLSPTTGQSIFTQAWVDLGVGSPGETPGPSESQNGLAKLNQMLDSWAGARDLVYEILLNNYTLTATQSFPIGPSAAAPFNVPRPTKIETATIWITTAAGVVLKFELDIIPQKKWAQIDDLSVTGTVPQVLYVDPAVPNATLNFWPIPKCVDPTAVELSTWNSIGQIATLGTVVNLPPTYLRAITLGLEIELIPSYGALVSQAIIQMRTEQFKEAIAVLRDLNSRVQLEMLGPTAPAQQNNAQPQQGGVSPQIAQLLAQMKGGQ